MDKAAMAGVDADMTRPGITDAEKQQVTGADGVQGYGGAGAELLIGGAGDVEPAAAMYVKDQATAIKALTGTAAAIQVRGAELLAAEPN